jgi:hypothetical protein
MHRHQTLSSPRRIAGAARVRRLGAVVSAGVWLGLTSAPAPLPGDRLATRAPAPTAAAPHLRVGPPPQLQQVPYNGAFTFTRIRYGPGESLGGSRRGRGWGSSAWAHEYPDADRNIQTILDEFTSVRANTDGSNVLDLEDRELFRYPLIYMSEPGYWTITDDGARTLRDYLLKGGFLIFDDFEADQWHNMAAQLARALPEGEWVRLEDGHPVFQGFFAVEDIYVPHPLVDVTPAYYAIFEGNDPARRIMVLANHNADLAEYWEWSATGYFPVDPTNDAYRLGVNYVIYGLTH